MRTWMQWLAAIGLTGGSVAGAQQVGATVALAPLAGPNYTPAPGQAGLQFYGTDLGYTFTHDGELRILFGDTLITDALVPLLNDDAQGTLPFARCPGGREVDRFVRENAPPDSVWWQRIGPPLDFATLSAEQLSFIEVALGGFPLTMTGLQTPIGAFSDGRDHAFGVFNRTDPAECNAAAADPGCGPGLTCDDGFGVCDALPFERPCLLGIPSPGQGSCPEGSSCLPIGGYCRDETSSVDDGTVLGRFLSLAQSIQIGAADATRAEHYRATPWVTNKFINLALRTVDDFNPARRYGIGNDYRAADGRARSREQVFVWGRPNFVGSKQQGREAQLYFMVADMPRVDASGAPTWAPRYFTGVGPRGVPRFSPDPTQAIPLDLANGQADPHEPVDIINQMTVSWVPALGKWVMLYGGDLDPLIAAVFNFGAVRDPDGAIHVRFADQPWGPWTQAEPLLRGGNPYLPTLDQQYAEGGLLFHPACTGPDCIAGDARRASDPSLQPYGRLYGPNIIDCWTESRGNQVDLYWNVSTWNPYQVALIKTRITRGHGRTR